MFYCFGTCQAYPGVFTSLVKIFFMMVVSLFSVEMAMKNFNWCKIFIFCSCWPCQEKRLCFLISSILLILFFIVFRTMTSVKETPAASVNTGVTKFLGEPKIFSGSTSVAGSNGESNPVNWLKKLDRLKKCAKFSDEAILIVAADHLTDRAESWFDVHCSDIVSWDAFRIAFQKKYCSGREDFWWEEVHNLRQGVNQGVEDIEIKLRELFSLLQVTDEKVKIRYFLQTIFPSLAMEVEKNGVDLSNFDAVVDAALGVEKINQKYSKKGVSMSDNGSVVSLGGGDLQSVGASDTTSLKDLIAEFRDLKINFLKVTSENNRHHNAQVQFNSNNNGVF